MAGQNPNRTESGSPIETEVKIHWDKSALAARRHIVASGYHEVEGRTLETDQIYDHPHDELRMAGKLLRLRQTFPDKNVADEKAADESSIEERAFADKTSDDAGVPRIADRATVTYKGPALGQKYKSREEIEFDVSDALAFALVLARLEYVPKFLYQKYRTKFGHTGEPGIITLDETPIGVFLELEGPEYWIDATATRLGFAPFSYSTASYSSLYREYRLKHPEAPLNMVFEPNQSSNTEGKEP